jgi:hypothetical protein
MNRWRVAAVVAGFLAACVAVPAQASDWCIHDPQVIIATPGGHSVTVYVTEGALGSQHQAALAAAKIGYLTSAASKGTLRVTVFDYIPRDEHGNFPTEMIVSSEPFGKGVVYGSVYGTSGVPMAVSFKIQKWAP